MFQTFSFFFIKQLTDKISNMWKTEASKESKLHWLFHLPVVKNVLRIQNVLPTFVTSVRKDPRNQVRWINDSGSLQKLWIPVINY